MPAKDSITAQVFTNTDMSEKLPLESIKTAKHPQCFRLERPPVPYFSNKTAWSTSQTFQKLLNYVFVPHIRSHTSKIVALVVKNTGSQSNLRDICEQATVIYLLSYFTAAHIPSDMVAILTWMLMYRRFLVHQLFGI